MLTLKHKRRSTVSSKLVPKSIYWCDCYILNYVLCLFVLKSIIIRPASSPCFQMHLFCFFVLSYETHVCICESGRIYTATWHQYPCMAHACMLQEDSRILFSGSPRGSNFWGDWEVMETKQCNCGQSECNGGLILPIQQYYVMDFKGYRTFLPRNCWAEALNAQTKRYQQQFGQQWFLFFQKFSREDRFSFQITSFNK